MKETKKKKRRNNLLKELLVEFPCDASPLSASSFELLRRDPDVLHVAAQHEVDLGFDQIVEKNLDFRNHPSLVDSNLKGPVV